MSGKGEAGAGAEPQVGEERVFPVSHEVIHGETSDFRGPLALPLSRYLRQGAGPKGCLGSRKWGVLESLPEGAVGGSLKLQDFRVRSLEFREVWEEWRIQLLGTSLDPPTPL